MSTLFENQKVYMFGDFNINLCHQIFTTDVFHQHVANASFPNYEFFTDVNAAYSDYSE